MAHRIFTKDNIMRIDGSAYFSDDRGRFTSYDKDGNVLCPFSFIGDCDGSMLQAVSGREVYLDRIGYLGKTPCLRFLDDTFAAYYVEGE